MKINSVAHAIFLTLAVWALSGCVGSPSPRPQVEHYAIEYDAPLPGGAFFPAVVEVKRFAVSPLLNTDRMIYRDRELRRNEYRYHLWRANPGEMVSWFLLRDLRESRRVTAVFMPGGGLKASHVVEGVVEAFHEEDGPGAWEAVMNVSVTVLLPDESDRIRRIVFQKSYATREPCSKKNPEALARAMSLGLSRISAEFREDLIVALSAAAAAPR